MPVFAFVFVKLLAVAAVCLGIGYAMSKRRQRLLAERRDKQLALKERATPETPRRDPDLPAYVDPEDPAAMAAWRAAQSELETSW